MRRDREVHIHYQTSSVLSPNDRVFCVAICFLSRRVDNFAKIDSHFPVFAILYIAADDDLGGVHDLSKSEGADPIHADLSRWHFLSTEKKYSCGLTSQHEQARECSILFVKMLDTPKPQYCVSIRMAGFYRLRTRELVPRNEGGYLLTQKSERGDFELC